MKYRGRGFCYELYLIILCWFNEKTFNIVVCIFICIIFFYLKKIKVLFDFIEFKFFFGIFLKEIFIVVFDDFFDVLVEMFKMDFI